jgi:hypothetical protein
MGAEERIGWMLLGMAVGFIAGYIVRSLRELREDVHVVKEELHEVDGIVKHKLGERNGDDGFMSNRYVADIAMILCMIIVLGAALLSQKASNDVHTSTGCTQEFLVKTIVALNERTEFAGAQAESNVELQRAQQQFFELLLRKPPETEARRSAAAQEYLKNLNEFITLNTKTADKVAQNPYPTNEQLQDCLN